MCQPIPSLFSLRISFALHYCDEQFDPDLGFYYLRARYLSLNTGRFWTMDTNKGDHEDPQSLHKYLYANSNPINNKDPLGLNVYKVGLPSGIAGSLVAHRMIVGDDGNGGSYTLDFYPGKVIFSVFGVPIVGQGGVYYFHDPLTSATAYINSNATNGFYIMDTVKTDYAMFYPNGESVDSFLTSDASKLKLGDFGKYILLPHDCGTFCNWWLGHARDVVKQSEASVPTGSIEGCDLGNDINF